MAKKKVTRRNTAREPDTRAEPESVDEARRRVREAREQLRQAKQQYAQLRGDAPAQDADAPEATIKNLIDDSRRFVRKYPALGVSAAAAVGFFFGRLFRR